MAQQRWYTITEYVNAETGEIITKSQFERGNFRIIKTEKKYEHEGSYGIRKILKQFREHEQTKLEL